VDLVRVVEETTPVTTVVHCGDQLDTIMRAWQCHASQVGGMGPIGKLPRPLLRLWSGRESFTRVQPPPRPGARREGGLFAGLGSEAVDG
jgi:hypothetical protein